MRPVNFHVTGRAICVLRVLVMLWTTRLDGSDVMGHAVAGEAELIDCAKPQQPGIGRAMRRVTCRTTFRLQGRMFVGKWPLLVGMTFNAGGIRAGGKPCLF
ncbi:MAG: hypothetical protein QOF62_2541 [Pyrinomonadaceae bacterium]|nr:hypothetical protein [Pyrinomonadaceae bacterium]